MSMERIGTSRFFKVGRQRMCALGLLAIAHLVCAADFSAFSHSLRLTLNTGTIGLGANVLQYPMLIRLSTASARAVLQTARAGGADVRFSKSDNATPLPYEIDQWSTEPGDSSAAIWVKLDTVYAATGTAIVMHWGNADSIDGSNPDGVFTNGYLGVYHLKEGAGPFADASPNHRIATGTGTTATGAVKGLIGKSDSLNGTTQYISAAAMPIDNASYSASCWAKRARIGHEDQFVSQGNAEQCESVQEISCQADNTLFTGHWCSDMYCSATLADMANFHFFTSTFDAAARTLTLYFDGAMVNSIQTAAALNTGGAPFHIGFRDVNLSYGNAVIEEVRMSSIRRDADWIKLDYQSQQAGAGLIEILPLKIGDNTARYGRQHSQDIDVRYENGGRTIVAHVKAGQLRIYNSAGAAVGTSTGNGRCMLDAATAPPGTYYATLCENGRLAVQRLSILAGAAW
jgi:hypothetical protein